MDTHILLIYTGGTIGMRRDAHAKTLSTLCDIASVMQQIPLLTTLEQRSPSRLAHLALAYQDKGYCLPLANGNRIVLDVVSFSTLVDSVNIAIPEQQLLVRIVQEYYQTYDGFVILHGTDTMAYTASALSFMFCHLSKPIVLTGAQIPIFEAYTDAVDNCLNAFHIAGYKASGLPAVNEVTIMFGNCLLRGNRATKVHTLLPAAFDSPNYPPLANVADRVVINRQVISKPNVGQFGVRDRLSDGVILLYLTPSMPIAALRALLRRGALRGLVLATFGAGNVPHTVSILLESALESGIVIIILSQCAAGSVQFGRYQTSAFSHLPNLIAGMGMTKEAAVSKLMWGLENCDLNNLPDYMKQNQRGELDE